MKNHSPQKCWWRPDVKCNKCGKQGHVERICKNQQQEETSATVDYCQEEQLFAATCFANKSTSKSYVGQLVEKEFKVYFEDRNCIIKDLEGKQVRLGHFHHDCALHEEKSNSEGLPDLEKDLPIRATCQYGKQTKLSFPKKTSWRATQKLQLVHTDVGGPQKTPSLKRNACNRKNRMILEMTRCLLHEKDLPKKFWAEIASTTIYFLNRLPTKALKKFGLSFYVQDWSLHL
ncbi:hypothetical protein AAG906_028932 [Vitis piasezkii]